ncbi:Polysaccharide biosynthesis/export protein [Anatilimnocola aggregata]|uniref:Polysaccharide biosynthesis/export protein n=1 Tax=Anatilimnocola aggregata TaxID=2528021 RepID=A0A517Y6B9_9BACT|nr:polysaccharide biosynthesis/export family protein [Anatilimnocola aggregata]QDU25775.1 Polysaccharide biosynthesis/export protein [Anatilimnocola aggregata]
MQRTIYILGFLIAACGLVRQSHAQTTTYAAACNTCNTGACGNACERQINGIDCAKGDGCGEQRWNSWGPIPWQAFQQGEYIGPARTAHLHQYRLRVDDQVEFIYRVTRSDTGQPYRLQTGDVLRIESLIDTTLNREVTIQTDGTIILPLVGQLKASKLTIMDVQKLLEERYKKYYKIPDITVTPVKTNTRLEDLKASVDNRFFSGGQGRNVRVNPEGTVSLPGIDQVPAQGLTLEEVKREVNARYDTIVEGLEVTPNLFERAPRSVFVVGEVRNGGRFAMEGPTTAMQAIALAGGWNVGANLRNVVVFRRADDWRLLATKLDIRGALYGERPMPADEIWLRDSDIVVVPKSSLQRFDDIAEMVFTKGVYAVLPTTFTYQFGGGTGSTVITSP